jgi:hypothetical protein
MNPRVIKESGYKHLDRVVNLVSPVKVHSDHQCAKYGIYSIIDLHTAPGGKPLPLRMADRTGQNQGWHCDSGISHSTCKSHRKYTLTASLVA